MPKINRHLLLIWALGLTQICGYGTEYYSLSILSGDIARDFCRSNSWFFFIFSAALIAGGAVMPFAGRLFDRVGAARLMTLGSALGAVSLAFTAVSPNVAWFALGMAFIQIFSGLVLYDAAFTSIVQSGVAGSQNRIMHLTLIAGFASTIFWPLTTALDNAFGWRVTLWIFAAINLLICLPVHAWIAKVSGGPAPTTPIVDEIDETTPRRWSGGKALRLMIFITAGFSLSSVTLSAILSQMVPMLQALGIGTLSLYVSTLFGPAQAAMRAINLFFGGGRHPLNVTFFALSLMPLALFVLALTAPWTPGAIVFAVLVGLSSGLKSIVQGTLPLAVFGRNGYGARIGIMSGIRYVMAAMAPFTYAWVSDVHGARTTAVVFGVIGVTGLLCFVDVARVLREGTPV